MVIDLRLIVALLLGGAASCRGVGDDAQNAGNGPGLAEAERVLVGESNHEVHPWCRSDSLNDYLITRDSLGPITTVIDRTRLHRVCPAVRDTIVFEAEGRELEASVLLFGGREIGRVEWSESGNLERLRVTSARVQTSQGIRVGSTMTDIRQALIPLSAGYDDGGIYVWITGQGSLSYVIDWPEIFDVLRSPDDVAERPEAIPDSAMVRAILFGPWS